MNYKTLEGEAVSLAKVMPGHQFSEHHHGIVDAPREVVWQSLQRLRWTDLRLTRPMMWIRGLGGGVLRDRVVETFTQRAGAALVEEPPRLLLLAMVGKPWSAVPTRIPAGSVADVRAFAEPGWLKYGMEWVLHPLPEDRTLVETRTLCVATDATAQRRFGLYWLGIRGASGLVRREMIAALARLSLSA